MAKTQNEIVGIIDFERQKLITRRMKMHQAIQVDGKSKPTPQMNKLAGKVSLLTKILKLINE